MKRLGFGVVMAGWLAMQCGVVWAADCAGLKNLKLDATTITAAENITGELTVEGEAPMGT